MHPTLEMVVPATREEFILKLFGETQIESQLGTLLKVFDSTAIYLVADAAHTHAPAEWHRRLRQSEDFQEKFMFPAAVVDDCDTADPTSSKQYVIQVVRSKSQTNADATRIKRVPTKPLSSASAHRISDKANLFCFVPPPVAVTNLRRDDNKT